MSRLRTNAALAFTIGLMIGSLYASLAFVLIGNCR